MRSRYCSATSRASHLPARTPSAIATAVAPRAIRAVRSRRRHLPSRAPDPGRIRGTWKKLPSRRGAFASASSSGSDGFTSSSRVGQSNGTACVIGSIDGRVERAQGIDILEDRAQIVGHRRDLLLGQAQARQQREFTDFVGGDARHDRVAVHTTINRADPVRVRLRVRPEFATKHATRYSVGSDMTPSGNRFRALLVCLTPAVCLAIGCDGGGRDAGRADAAGRVLGGAVGSFRGQPRSARDRLGARLPRRRPPDPRPTSWGWSIRWRPPRRIRDACCATSISRTARWRPAAAPSISRSWAASASAWARGAPSTVIRTFPRVYPDVAGVVGGVVGEAAPQPIASLPEHVSSDLRRIRSCPSRSWPCRRCPSCWRSTVRRRLPACASTRAAA